MERFTKAIEHRSESKVIRNVLFDNGVGQWKSSDKRLEAWSNMPAIQQLCRQYRAECMISGNHVICSLQGSSDEIKHFRAALNGLQSPETVTIPTVEGLFAGEMVHLEAVKQLTKLGQAYDTSIIVTRSQLYLVGLSANVHYTKFKLKVLLQHFEGKAVDKMDIPLSTQNLVFGPSKMHLLNIFEQTAVNTYVPPSILAGTVSNGEWDCVYLVGDPAQIAVAKIMLSEIITKTDVLLQTCVLALPTIDVLYENSKSKISGIMAQYATFIQWPRNSSTVRVLGTTRKSIQCTINALMKFCTHVYTVAVTNLQSTISNSQIGCLAKVGVSVHCAKGDMVLCGTDKQCHAAANLLRAEAGALVTFSLELDLQLKDFLAGKKNGKISKVMTQASSKIWFEPFHEQNLKVLMQCGASDCVSALKLLEDELPAEKEIYIPESFHKQIIGAGGARIQTLMRRYNVYIKFEANGDKVLNAVANLKLNNVLVRCPRKHAANIAPAIDDLQANVQECKREHRTTYLKLSRNHRRLLVSSHANLIREVEHFTNAVIAYPERESRYTELLEISGLGESSIMAARRLQEHLPYDYEFRVAHTHKFSQNVGPQSDFAQRVTLPLRAAFNVQVQAFESVQMERDSTVYSQIMVSMDREDDFVVNEVDALVTSYLRDHSLDIIEKGPLSTNLVVEGTAKTCPGTENMMNFTPRRSPFKFTRTAGAPMTPTPLNQWRNIAK